MAGITPGSSTLEKWAYYRGRYGALHAALSYLGRRFPRLWHIIGPRATRRYLKSWLTRPSTKRYVNLGSGSHVLEGFLNADVDARADVYVDIARPLPFPTGSVAAVLLEEVIEHLSFLEASTLTAELARILKRGGVVRVSTPDMAFLMDLAANDYEMVGMLVSDARRFLGTNAPEALLRMGFINSSFYLHGHQCLYTQAGLVELFKSAGLEDFLLSGYRDRHSALGQYDSHAERFNHPRKLSLYMEFMKPTRRREE